MKKLFLVFFAVLFSLNAFCVEGWGTAANPYINHGFFEPYYARPGSNHELYTFLLEDGRTVPASYTTFNLTKQKEFIFYVSLVESTSQYITPTESVPFDFWIAAPDTGVEIGAMYAPSSSHSAGPWDPYVSFYRLQYPKKASTFCFKVRFNLDLFRPDNKYATTINYYISGKIYSETLNLTY